MTLEMEAAPLATGPSNVGYLTNATNRLMVTRPAATLTDVPPPVSSPGRPLYGIAAVNAAKVECIHGHAFDSANTYIRRRPGAGRDCRRCHAGGKRGRQTAAAASGVAA